MKIISLAIMGLSCALTGRYIALRLSKRVRILEKIVLMFGIIENEIRYLSRPTSEVIKVLTQRDELRELDFLPLCLSFSENGEDIDTAWIHSIESSEHIGGEELCLLYSFGENLGRSDADGQISNCCYHSSLAQERLSEARQKRAQYASLVCGLGMLSGIGIFIILF